VKRDTQDIIIFVGLIVVKVLATARTAVDMWNLTHDWLNVALLDGMMLAFWLAAAYGGKSKEAMALRPFAAVGAWLLYAAQVYVGWAAHHEVTAILVRFAPGLALLFDTYEYGVHWLQRRQGARGKGDKRAGLRRFVANIGYYVLIFVTAPAQWVVQVFVLGRDVWRDTAVTFSAPARAPVTKTVTAHVPVTSPVHDTAQELSTEERRERVRRLHGRHSVTDLADMLNVSRKTIYRDFEALGLATNGNGHNG